MGLNSLERVSFPFYPLPHVWGAIRQSGSVGLCSGQQEHTCPVHNTRLREIKNEPRTSFGADEELQLGAVIACDVSAEGQHDDIAVSCALHSKRHRGGSGDNNVMRGKVRASFRA